MRVFYFCFVYFVLFGKTWITDNTLFNGYFNVVLAGKREKMGPMSDVIFKKSSSQKEYKKN